jgi:hypothetical protein
MIGMMTMIPTKIRRACMLGHGAPEHVPASGPVLGPNNALSKICLIMSGFTTPSPAEMTIATPTMETLRRYGRKMATTRLTVVPEIGRLSSSEIGRRK